ncbi:MAG: radical SAM protein [Magnetospirillum sp.]|nr:radical SAM protein [Magnetospirillum sp.]
MPNSKLENYLVRRISPDETYANLLRFPRFFEIETVNACNARCPMCTIDDWQRHTPVMKDDVFEKIAQELGQNAHEVKRVSLYRDGEPLLDKKMPQRIARLKRAGIRQVSISTNAGLLDEGRARAILEAGLDQIILSIDSINKPVFEAIRARLVLEEVLENSLRLIRLRDEMKAKTQIWVRMIRQESNYDEWDAYKAFWEPKLSRQDRLSYHMIHNWGSQLKDFKAVAPSYEPGLPCIALWSLMVIFADGRVPLCNVDYNDKHPSGDVAATSIAEVWRNKVMNERRAWHLAGEKGRIDMCANCNVWDEPSDKTKVASEFSEAFDVV